MIWLLADQSGGASTQLLVGIVLLASSAFFGRSWLTERASRNKLAAETTKTDVDAAHSQAQTVRQLLEGAEAIASWRKEALAAANKRIDLLEAAAIEAAKRLEECERHSQTIDDLRARQAELGQRFEAERARADRYRRERNEARDELLDVRNLLNAANGRIDELERRLDNP